MLSGDAELLGILPVRSPSALWVALDAVHGFGWRLEVGMCCVSRWAGGLCGTFLVILLVGCFGRWARRGEAAPWETRAALAPPLASPLAEELGYSGPGAIQFKAGLFQEWQRDRVQPLCWFLLEKRSWLLFPNCLCPLGCWALVTAGLSQMIPKGEQLLHGPARSIPMVPTLGQDNGCGNALAWS